MSWLPLTRLGRPYASLQSAPYTGVRWQVTFPKKLAISGATLLVLIVGAKAYVHTSESLPSDKEEFRNLVESSMPIEESVVGVQKVLEDLGFRVTRSAAKKNFDDQRDYLHATFKAFSFPVCEKEWRVVAKIEESKIAEINTHIFLTCP